MEGQGRGDVGLLGDGEETRFSFLTLSPYLVVIYKSSRASLRADLLKNFIASMLLMPSDSVYKSPPTSVLQTSLFLPFPHYQKCIHVWFLKASEAKHCPVRKKPKK